MTAQNTCGVRGIQAVDAAILSAQIDAVLEDIPVAAIKIGMVYTCENVRAIRDALRRNHYQNPLVLDPVLVATSGADLATDGFLDLLKKELFPLCTLLTPNLTEAAEICGRNVQTVSDMAECGRDIIRRYSCRNVLVKGGHSEGDAMTDVLVLESGEVKTFTARKIDSENTHGTGCTLSSAIATYLAEGHPLEEAVSLGKEYVYQAIAAAKDCKIGRGHGSTNHFWKLKMEN